MCATPSCFAISGRFSGVLLILLRRSARNHFQVRDLRQPRQDFVLNAFGEISVRLVLAQVLEGQDGDRFLRDRLESLSRPGRPLSWDGRMEDQQGRCEHRDAGDECDKFPSAPLRNDSLGETSSVRFIPSGVISKAQAMTSATGKPSNVMTTTGALMASGRCSAGTMVAAICMTSQPITHKRPQPCKHCVASVRRRSCADSSNVLRRDRGHDFLEARIAAERIPERLEL